jgi:phage terminase large subunit-like protein
VLSADANSKFGYSVHGLLFDELMAQPNRLLWDALTTASGARRQPIIFAISTAGFDRHSICWEIHEYATKVLDGTVDDPSFLPVLFGAADDDDWTSPKIWKSANPSYGVTVKADYIKQECARAKVTPTYENTFRRLLLNQWTEQESRWLQMSEWDACAGAVDLDKLKGRPCYAGLDLASTTDIASLVLLFPGDPFQIVPYFWIPEDRLQDRVKQDRVPYDVWVREGLMQTTPGNLIDYRWIMLQIGKASVDYDLRALAFDRWGSQKIVTDLVDEIGFVTEAKDAERFNKPLLIQFGQGFASMNPPTKEFLNMILARKIAHGNNAVLRWMAQNVVVKQDPAGNVKPDKAKSTEKIDGIVATIMALGIALAQVNNSEVLYRDKDLVVL